MVAQTVGKPNQSLQEIKREETNSVETVKKFIDQSIVKHKQSPKRGRQNEKNSTVDKRNESTISIVDKSIGKSQCSPKRIKHEEVHCDAVTTTKDKSKIFLLPQKNDKVNMNIQYPPLYLSQYFPQQRRFRLMINFCMRESN
jgi:hypothetical protein